MKKIVVKNLPILVGAAILVLLNFPFKVALSQIPTSSQTNQLDESLSDEPIVLPMGEATPSTLDENTTQSTPNQTPSNTTFNGEASDATSSTGTLNINSPDIKVTQHIRSFSLDYCAKEVGSIEDFLSSPSVVAACSALAASHNTEPPNSFNSSSWQTFKNSREYRGYIHIPSIKVSCSKGRLTNYTISKDEYSYGYTKRPPLGFDSGDVYKPPYNTYTIGTSAKRDYLIVIDRRSSRIGDFERRAQYGLLGYDGPFIYTAVEEDIYCDGSIRVLAYRPEFPTTRLYIDNQLNTEAPQTKLGDFIKSGGRNFHNDGEGNFGPAGNTLIYQHLPPDRPCTRGGC
jgi:hypothetical protein